jgi:hypothetical protein
VPVGAGADGQLATPDAPRAVGWWVGSAAYRDNLVVYAVPA